MFLHTSSAFNKPISVCQFEYGRKEMVNENIAKRIWVYENINGHIKIKELKYWECGTISVFTIFWGLYFGYLNGMCINQIAIHRLGKSYRISWPVFIRILGHVNTLSGICIICLDLLMSSTINICWPIWVWNERIGQWKYM